MSSEREAPKLPLIPSFYIFSPSPIPIIPPSFSLAFPFPSPNSHTQGSAGSLQVIHVLVNVKNNPVSAGIWMTYIATAPSKFWANPRILKTW